MAQLENAISDVALLCRRFEVDTSSLQADLEHELAGFRTGNARTPVFSAHMQKLFEQAWLIASLDAHNARIRSAQLLLALLTQPGLSQVAHRGSRLFSRFPVEALKHRLDEVTRGSAEATATPPAKPAAGAGDAVHLAPGTGESRTPALERFTTDLTQRAHEGLIDPVIGRDAARSGRPLTSSCDDARTTPSSPAKLAWARPRWWKDWRCALPPATCPRRCAAWHCARWIWACCKQVPASRASSSTGSGTSSTTSSVARSPSCYSSTRPIP